MPRIVVEHEADPELQKIVQELSNKLIKVILGQRSDAIIEALASSIAIYIKEYVSAAYEVDPEAAPDEDAVFMFLGGRIKHYLDNSSFISEDKPN